MSIITGAPDGATERPFTSGGIGWLASSSFGPRISFAPEGLGGGASSGDAGGAEAGDAAGEPSQPESTRDAVLAAFEKLEKGDDQQPADANAQKPMTADARARDQHGRFAASQEQGKPPAPAGDQQQPGPEAKDQSTEEGKQAARAAPPGWSPQSKEAFNSLPDFVKADIAKREQEVNQGLSELRDYRDLRPFRDMAQRSGTTLPAVLSEVTKMEETLQSNPVAAIGALSQMYGFDIRQVVTGLAGALGMQIGQQPAGEQQPQQQPQQPLTLPREVIDRLARVDRLEAHIQGQAQTQMKSAIQSFADDPTNEFFENVGSEISQIIASDLDRFRSMPPHLAVKEAYDKAVWLNPDTRAVLIKRQAEAEGRAATERMQATAHQARQAAKGLSGTPVNGATPGSRPPAPQSTRDAVAQAWDMHADI